MAELKKMPLMTKGETRREYGCGIWHVALTLDQDGVETTYSDIYTLPVCLINGIAVRQDTGLTFQFSNDSYSVLEADGGTFEDWDGSSEINPGVTAWRIEIADGQETELAAVITVRGELP